MAPRTPEQQRAVRVLGDAVVDVMRAHGMAADSVLGDWILVAAEVRFDDDGDPMAAYHTLHPNGASLDHTALGLLEMGRHFVLYPESGQDPADDEGEERT